jgi:hypothetical protein
MMRRRRAQGRRTRTQTIERQSEGLVSSRISGAANGVDTVHVARMELRLTPGREFPSASYQPFC